MLASELVYRRRQLEPGRTRVVGEPQVESVNPGATGQCATSSQHEPGHLVARVPVARRAGELHPGIPVVATCEHVVAQIDRGVVRRGQSSPRRYGAAVSARPDRAIARPLSGRLPPWRYVAVVAVGGAVGALARVALAEAFPVAADGVPWTTLWENVVGALLLGLLLTLLTERLRVRDEVRLAVCTGALGAFTTYSTFATELAERWLDGHVLHAAAYAVASVTLGLAAALAGVWLARHGPWTPHREPVA